MLRPIERNIKMEEIVQLEPKKMVPIWSAEVEQEISCENNKLNNMIKKQLKETAKEYQLSEKGTSKILCSRLKAYVKKQKLISLNILPNPIEHKYLVIIDFEATCNQENNLEKQEIIEFPAILFDSEKRESINEFRSYVKPTINPTLTNFCQELTGITQNDIDEAPLFLEVLNNFEQWLRDNGLNPNEPDFIIVTDGSSDVSSYLLGQCEISDLQMPKWGEKWVNIKKTYSNFYQYYRIPITEMLSYAGMQLLGRLHKGIDDARNISRIVNLLLEDGAQLIANECLVLDPTNPRGYTLSNMIKKENNETIIEKKVPSEIMKSVNKEGNMQQQIQSETIKMENNKTNSKQAYGKQKAQTETNKKENNKPTSKQAYGKQKTHIDMSKKENKKKNISKKIFKKPEPEFVLNSNDFPAL